MHEQPDQITVKNKKAIKALLILFVTEILLVALALAVAHHFKDAGAGGLVLVLPFMLFFGTFLTMLVVIPTFAIIALRKKQAKTGAERTLVWSSLLLNLAVACIIAVDIIITVVRTATT